MKRLTAILLLGIFSFNLFGYRLVASLLETSANAKMELALDENDYTDNDLVSIKQPTNLPYYQNSKAFQRVDGEIEIDGVYYKYVKRRIFNDSLEMLCIPNTPKMKIMAAKADFSKLAVNDQQSDNKKKSGSAKSFHQSVSEFESLQQSGDFKLQSCSLDFFSKNTAFIKDSFTKSVEQPPDFSSIIS